MELEIIENKIHIINHHRVMLDFDLAKLYDIETRALKQAVKRNIDRFPDDFMFVLSETDIDLMVSQNVIPSKSYFGGAQPYAFTELGVAMLSSILKSKKAVQVNISIMRVFVELRKAILFQHKIIAELKDVKLQIGEHDAQLKAIYDALENLLDKNVEEAKWENRNRIGFKTNK